MLHILLIVDEVRFYPGIVTVLMKEVEMMLLYLNLACIVLLMFEFTLSELSQDRCLLGYKHSKVSH